MAKVEGKKVVNTEKVNRLDALTGLITRQEARKIIQEFLDTSSVASPYAVLIIDLKEFKKVNEAYSRMFGDSVLIQVADAIIESINRNDIAGRLGGDEFIIFLRNVGKKSVLSICDKLRRLINDIYIGSGKKLDVAIGGVVTSDTTIPLANLLQTADDALYELMSTTKSGINLTSEITIYKKERAYSTIDKNATKESRSSEKRLSELIFELLEQASDIDKAVGAVLSLVGDKKNLTRISAYSKDENIKLLYKWKARNIKDSVWSEPEKLYDFAAVLNEEFPEPDMFVVDKARLKKYMPDKLKEFKNNDVETMICCNMIEFGKVMGIMCFATSAEYEWTDKDFKAFKTVTRLVTAFTVKGKAIKELKL